MEHLRTQSTVKQVPPDVKSAVALSFPKSHYPALRKKGELSFPLKIETLSVTIKVPVEKIMLFGTISKSTKNMGLKKYAIVFTFDQVYLVNETVSPSAIKHYNFMEIEVVKHDVEELKFSLQFYKFDKSKQKIKYSSAINCRNFICNSKEDKDNFTYIFDRQIPRLWQGFFEQKLPILGADLYQYHVYILKHNIRGKLQPRFIILTLDWLCNVKMGIAGNTFVFQKLIWKAPIAAIKQLLVVGVVGDYKLKIIFDKNIQNDILAKNKLKKLSKYERKFQFSEGELCRMFVYHLKRLWGNLTHLELPVEIK